MSKHIDTLPTFERPLKPAGIASLPYAPYSPPSTRLTVYYANALTVLEPLARHVIAATVRTLNAEQGTVVHDAIQHGWVQWSEALVRVKDALYPRTNTGATVEHSFFLGTPSESSAISGASFSKARLINIALLFAYFAPSDLSPLSNQDGDAITFLAQVKEIYLILCANRPRDDLLWAPRELLIDVCTLLSHLIKHLHPETTGAATYRLVFSHSPFRQAELLPSSQGALKSSDIAVLETKWSRAALESVEALVQRRTAPDPIAEISALRSKLFRDLLEKTIPLLGNITPISVTSPITSPVGVTDTSPVIARQTAVQDGVGSSEHSPAAQEPATVKAGSAIESLITTKQSGPVSLLRRRQVEVEVIVPSRLSGSSSERGQRKAVPLSDGFVFNAPQRDAVRLSETQMSFMNDNDDDDEEEEEEQPLRVPTSNAKAASAANLPGDSKNKGKENAVLSSTSEQRASREVVEQVNIPRGIAKSRTLEPRDVIQTKDAKPSKRTASASISASTSQGKAIVDEDRHDRTAQKKLTGQSRKVPLDEDSEEEPLEVSYEEELYVPGDSEDPQSQDEEDDIENQYALQVATSLTPPSATLSTGKGKADADLTYIPSPESGSPASSVVRLSYVKSTPKASSNISKGKKRAREEDSEPDDVPPRKRLIRNPPSTSASSSPNLDPKTVRVIRKFQEDLHNGTEVNVRKALGVLLEVAANQTSPDRHNLSSEPPTPSNRAASGSAASERRQQHMRYPLPGRSSHTPKQEHKRRPSQMSPLPTQLEVKEEGRSGRRSTKHVDERAARETDEEGWAEEEEEEVVELEEDAGLGLSPISKSSPQISARSSKKRQATVSGQRSPPAPSRHPGSNMAGRNPWTVAEDTVLERALKEVYKEYREQGGSANRRWAKIMERHGPNGTEDTMLAKRTNLSAKDRARNLLNIYARKGKPAPRYLSSIW